MKTVQDQQKSYVDKRQTKLEFLIGDFVFVKFSPLKRVMRFGNSRKQAQRFVGTFSILERIGCLAYGVKLPEKIGVHIKFHVSHLRKYVQDSSTIGEPGQLEDMEL